MQLLHHGETFLRGSMVLNQNPNSLNASPRNRNYLQRVRNENSFQLVINLKNVMLELRQNKASLDRKRETIRAFGISYSTYRQHIWCYNLL